MLFSIQMSSSIFAFSQVSEDVCNHLSPSVDRSGLALFSPFKSLSLWLINLCSQVMLFLGFWVWRRWVSVFSKRLPKINLFPVELSDLSFIPSSPKMASKNVLGGRGYKPTNKCRPFPLVCFYLINALWLQNTWCSIPTFHVDHVLWLKLAVSLKSLAVCHSSPI